MFVEVFASTHTTYFSKAERSGSLEAKFLALFVILAFSSFSSALTSTNATGFSLTVSASTFVTGCRDLNVTGTTYVLTNSVASAGTCFNVTAANVTLNCAGFTVNFSGSTLGYGVLTNSTNTTVKNCVINQTAFNTSCYGLYLHDANNGTFTNNNITSNGTTVWLNNADYNAFSYSNWTSINASWAVNIGSFSSLNTFVNITVNAGTDPNGASGIGIATGANSFWNTTVYTYATLSEGIEASSDWNYFTDTRVTTKTGTSAEGILVYGENNFFERTWVSTATRTSPAITLRCNNSNFNNTWVTTLDNSNAHGINMDFPYDQSGMVFYNLNVSSASVGVNVEGTGNKTFNIYDSYITGLNGFRVTNVVNDGQWNFTNATLVGATSFGAAATGSLNVHWYSFVHSIDSLGADIATANVNVSNVNETGIVNLTTNATGWASATIQEYMRTAVSIYNFTPHYLNGSKSGYTSNYTTRMMSGNTYTPLVLQQILITNCGNLTANSTLGANIYNDSTCFTFGANSITLDCASHYVAGNGTNYTFGVFNNGYNNTVVKNCVFLNWSAGLLYDNANNSLIENVTSWNNTPADPTNYGTGLHLHDSNYTNVSYSNFSYNEYIGIYFNDSSSWNVLSHNNLINNSNVVGSGGFGIHIGDAIGMPTGTDNCSFNTIYNNTVIDNTYGTGISFTGEHSYSNVSYNNASFNYDGIFGQVNDSFFGFNFIYENEGTGIQLQNSRDTVLNNNTITGTGLTGQGLYFNNVANLTAYYNNVSYNDWGVELQGNESVFAFNTIAFNGAYGLVIGGENNTFIGNNVSYGAGDGVAFFANPHEPIHNVLMNEFYANNSGADIQSDIGFGVGFGGYNRFLNCSFNKSSINVTSGNFTVEWYTRVNVTSSTGVQLANANVTIYDNASNWFSSELTNASGITPTMQNITEFLYNASGLFNKTSNYTGSLAGYTDNNTMIMVEKDESGSVHLILTSSTPVTPPGGGGGGGGTGGAYSLNVTVEPTLLKFGSFDSSQWFKVTNNEAFNVTVEFNWTEESEFVSLLSFSEDTPLLVPSNSTVLLFVRLASNSISEGRTSFNVTASSSGTKDQFIDEVVVEYAPEQNFCGYLNGFWDRVGFSQFLCMTFYQDPLPIVLKGTVLFAALASLAALIAYYKKQKIIALVFALLALLFLVSGVCSCGL